MLISSRHGQSIVEIALLMPLILFTVIILFQLFMLVRAKILLSLTASHVITEVSLHRDPKIRYALDLKDYFLPHYQEGIALQMWPTLTRTPLSEWRAYGGIKTRKDKAELVSTDLRYFLNPRITLLRPISGKLLHAFDESIVEPAWVGNP